MYINDDIFVNNVDLEVIFVSNWVKNKFFLNLKSSTSWDICHNFSNINSKINNFFKDHKYDVLVLLGDRYESLAVAIAAYINRVPIAHIHGGEKTNDSLDDNYRHAISKFSNFHFVANLDAKRRLIKMGEISKNIYIVGCPSLDALKNAEEKSLKILNCLKEKSIMY